VRILFVIKHPASVRSLDAVFRMLDARGHRVHLAFGGIKPDAHEVLQRIADECSLLTFGSLPATGSPGWRRDSVGWTVLSKRLRGGSDFLRYLEPSYADAPALRARAEARAHPLVRRAATLAGVVGPAGPRALRRGLRWLDARLEPPPHVTRFLRDFEPDVVLVTNLARDSVQADYVRAANRLGIHTAYPVFSWDNLTNKGLVHELPELVLVWNELQADEAVRLHGIPRERVRVLGAWSYDHWFEWRPSRSREELCREVGLRPDRPIVLYVCSSEFVAPDEPAFVRRWIEAMRASGEPLAEVGVLVRPHPRNSGRWAGVSLDDPQAAIWPPLGEEPLEAASRGNYYDSIHHAAAVVGINTSAQIESAIVGRPVHTVLADEFRETQQGTLHFQYLRADDFGHLYVGRTMEEHLAQLAASVEGRADPARNERFLRRFVRPLGLDVPARPLYVEAVEELGARTRSPARAPVASSPVRLALSPLARVAARRAARRRREAPLRPDDDLRSLIRRLRRDRTGVRVVAGPWLGDETGELLYWIPFLRWLQLAIFGLRERMTVVAREQSAAWYEGIGAELVPPESPTSASEGAVLVPAALIDERRGQLAAGSPAVTFLKRRLEFAPLGRPDLPSGLDLPEEFVAVRFDPRDEDVGSALAGRCAVVALEPFERPAQSAVLARARGFVGSYGPACHLSVLLGVPAVGIVPARDGVDENDLRVVAAFLSRAPYGPLHVVERSAGAAEDAERALALLAAPTASLVRAG